MRKIPDAGASNRRKLEQREELYSEKLTPAGDIFFALRPRGRAFRLAQRSGLSALLALSLCLCASGCGESDSGKLPAVGVQGKSAYVISERATGPIVIVFPGRSSRTDDPTLGIRQMALRIAAGANGSVAIFSWREMTTARKWLETQAAARRAAGQPARVALVGHSWGGAAAANLAQELLASPAVDAVTLLATIDAIQQGYVVAGAEIAAGAGAGEGVFGQRLELAAFKHAPAPDGKKLLKHVNYYQLDSPYLHGGPIPTATENHEVWFDHGKELGHGNLDNFLSDTVATEVLRACAGGKE